MTSSFRPKVLLRSEETQGNVSVIANVVPPRWDGPPLHHHAFDESFYVLDGELTFQLGDELATAGPGAFVLAPAGAHHTLANLNTDSASYLLICTPAGFERYFAKVEAEQAGVDAPAWALEPAPPVSRVGPQIVERDDLDAARPIPATAGSLNVLARSEESGARVAVVETTGPAGRGGPPLHVHDFDEAFYILEGELTFQVRDELLTAGPGDLVFAQGGVPHTFANLSGAPAHYLIVITPAGFERYFDRMAAERAGVDPPPEASKPIPKVTRVGPRIGE